MKKTNFKFLGILGILFVTLIMLNSFFYFVHATDTTSTSDDLSNNTELEDKHSDLYISEEDEFNIKNSIDGNVFASVKTLNIDSKDSGGIISGNLYATAQTVNIKSDIVYLENNEDDFGNSKIESVKSYSIIRGNVFVTANKFVLEPKCEISGDLYICANEIELAQNSIIRGNVFVIGNNFNFNSEITNGDLYANVKNFNMKYYGFISRDLHVSAQNVVLEGVCRSAFLNAETITSTATFISKKDFNIDNCSVLTFSGEVKGNANINSKKISFKNIKEDASSINCKISGNLIYSAKEEITLPDNVVLGEANYTKYNNSNFKVVGSYFIGLLSFLLCVCLVYLIINKLLPNYISNLSNITVPKILLSLGIGLGILILVPILSLLLFITQIGSTIGLILLILYALLLIISTPIFIISIATFIKNKLSLSINTLICILLLAIIVSLLGLIPYAGFVISILIMLIGLGMLLKSLMLKK